MKSNQLQKHGYWSISCGFSLNSGAIQLKFIQKLPQPHDFRFNRLSPTDS